MQSIILLYIKETDGRPADAAIQSRIGREEMGKVHGTPYALRAELIEERQNMRMMVNKIWFLKSPCSENQVFYVVYLSMWCF